MSLGYWELPDRGLRRTYTYTSLGVQRDPMRIVGRSRGGARTVCVDSLGVMHLFCLIEGCWNRVGGGLDFRSTGCKLRGVCFMLDSLYFLFDDNRLEALNLHDHMGGRGASTIFDKATISHVASIVEVSVTRLSGYDTLTYSLLLY